MKKLPLQMLTQSDRFGHSVSQSGNILAVGAYLADAGGTTDAGAAYMYQDRGQWLCYLLKQGHRSRCKAQAMMFGYSVSQSGNILAVGLTKLIRGAQQCWGRLYL